MKIICKTLFDCTYTGITGNFRPGQIPFRDRAGQHIQSLGDWTKARNQQRNWEALLQVVSLTTQPHNIVTPRLVDRCWEFEFTVESVDVFGLNSNSDPLAGLKQNCTGVPMMTDLNEQHPLDPMLSSHGAEQNIWFEIINMALE
jgi:hypothetical protein